MGTKRKSKKISFGRRYLTLDRYMTGSFIKLFLWTFGLSAVIFFLFALLSLILGKWSIGDAFLQLSNPGGTIGEDHSAGIWIITVLLNLFGLFVLNGVILTLLVNWVSNRRERFNKGNARYNYIHKQSFAVIIGGHKMVANLAKSLITNDNIDFVLIQTKRDAEEVRKEVYALIEDEKLARSVIIYSGDRTSWHELAELGIEKSKEVFIIGETYEIDGSSHDAINMQCWELINEHIHYSESKEISKKIPCHIMFENQSTFSAFQFSDSISMQSECFLFTAFSLHETWAQQVLLCKNNASSEYIPLDGFEGINHNSDKRVHLIIIGMSKLGMALAIEAAHIAHYPNFMNNKAGNPRTLITFIDNNAKEELIYFTGRFRELFNLARWRYIEAPNEIIIYGNDKESIYDNTYCINHNTNKYYPWNCGQEDEKMDSPYFGNYLGKNLIDIDFEFINGDVALPAVQKYISDACADNLSKTTVAITLSDSSKALSTALYFERSVYKNVQEILVQQNSTGALVNAIKLREDEGLQQKYRTTQYNCLRPFGMLSQCDYLTETDNVIARLVAYTYHCLANNTTIEFEYKSSDNLDEFMNKVDKHWLSLLYDKSQGKSATAQRWSNIYCANSFETKARSVCMNSKISLDDIDINNLANTEHNRWVIEQLLLGMKPVDKSYAKIIPITNKELRTELKRNNIHPDIISNEILSDSSKQYDIAIVKVIPFVKDIARQYYQSKRTINL